MARINSAVVIAKLLGTEGFSDHVANQVEKYWRYRSGLTERQQKSVARLEKEITRICESFSEGDKLILGKFIGLHKKMSFDTGLKGVIKSETPAY